MAMRSLVAAFLFVLILSGVAKAQTTVNPVDRREVIRTYTSTFLGGYSNIFNSTSPTYGTETRLFFEFDLSGYGPANSAIFYFSAFGYSPATIYLRPMTTAAEDGSITPSDFSRITSTFWSGQVTSSTGSFAVPITSGWNARFGGFGGFALTGSPGVQIVVLRGQNSGYIAYTPVPEPGTFALFGLGLGGLFLGHRMRRRRKQKSA